MWLGEGNIAGTPYLHISTGLGSAMYTVMQACFAVNLTFPLEAIT